MAPENKWKVSLKAALAEDLGRVLDSLEESIDPGSAFYNDLILQKGRYHQAVQDQHLGTTWPQDADITFARIRAALLSLIDQLKHRDLKKSVQSEEDGQKEPSLFYQAGKRVVSLDLNQLEASGLKRQADLLVRKLSKLRQRFLLIQGTDAAKEFLLEDQISQAEQQLNVIKEQLDS